MVDVPADAARARSSGDFGRAVGLYAQAAEAAETTAERLHFTLRQAYCHVDAGQPEEAAALARDIVAEARTTDILPVLCDALSLLVDDHMMNDRIGEATTLLAEARYVLDQLPDEPEMHQVVHNMAVTYERCDFPDVALQLFERAMRLASDAPERTFVLSGMAGAYHLALMYALDPAARQRFIDEGIRVTTSVLDDPGSSEFVADLVARAHRAAFLNAKGDHEGALADALIARKVAEESGGTNELVVALLAEAVARWRLHHDPQCIDLIDRAWSLATGPWTRRFPAAAWPVQLEALWETGQTDRLRAALGSRQRMVERDLRRERAGRLAHVELGVAHRRTERISETDPLTGLYNRRYLDHVLPEALANHGPICVAVFDLDGFKVVNDQFSYAQGDQVIRQVAAVLQDACRRGDFLGRLGGDEFVMVLCRVSPDHANGVLERITGLIADRRWEGLPDTLQLTASVGVAVGRAVADSHRVIGDASNALRLAKRSGRNRIVFA